MLYNLDIPKGSLVKILTGKFSGEIVTTINIEKHNNLIEVEIEGKVKMKKKYYPCELELFHVYKK